MGASKAQELIDIPQDVTTFFIDLDRVLTKCQGNLLTVGRAFKGNLEGVSTLVSIPYRIARLFVGEHKQAEVRERVNLAIRSAFSRPGALSDKVDSFNGSLEEMLSELSQPNVPRQLALKALDLAARTLEVSSLKKSIEEILRQALVLTWGAVEVLANDLAAELLNGNPQLASQVLKKVSDDHRLDVRTLEEYRFNLSESFGTYLCDRWPINSVKRMKDVLSLIFSTDPEVQRELARDDLWHLGQSRHLIVHRRGIVDSRHLRSIKSSVLSVGDLLPVTLVDVQRYQESARDLGIALLDAATGRTETAELAQAEPS
jgi:hypothetical protein